MFIVDMLASLVGLAKFGKILKRAKFGGVQPQGI
jgi:hypothetical protein